MNTNQRLTVAICLLLASMSLFTSRPCRGETRVRDLCRVKGMETNTLRGLGLVVGLNGTGEPENQVTVRALAQMLSLMGNTLPKNERGQAVLDSLKDAKNMALVFVTATVPELGAQQGDKLNCTVHSFGNAKSLKDGYLMITPLMGPNPADKQIYALAEGLVQLTDTPLTGRIHKGCKLEETFQNEFIKDGKITLVLDKKHANFQTAGEIADRINKSPIAQIANRGYSSGSNYEEIARAIGPVNIEVKIPEGSYGDDPVVFVSEVLDVQIFKLQNKAHVYINERAGTVVIGANVEIGPVAVTHKNINVEAGPFFPLDPGARAETTTKLKALVDALNAIKATDQDIIEIIKAIEGSGQLYGKLIIE